MGLTTQTPTLNTDSHPTWARCEPRTFAHRFYAVVRLLYDPQRGFTIESETIVIPVDGCPVRSRINHHRSITYEPRSVDSSVSAGLTMGVSVLETPCLRGPERRLWPCVRPDSRARGRYSESRKVAHLNKILHCAAQTPLSATQLV
jgi:hypothetical protein